MRSRTVGADHRGSLCLAPAARLFAALAAA